VFSGDTDASHGITCICWEWLWLEEIVPMFCLYGSAREGTVAILQACDSNDESCQEGEGLTSVVPRLRKDPIVEVDTVLHCTPFIFFVVTASKSAASRQIDIRNLAHYMSFILLEACGFIQSTSPGMRHDSANGVRSNQ
jgi:hypothetical protein